MTLLFGSGVFTGPPVNHRSCDKVQGEFSIYARMHYRYLEEHLTSAGKISATESECIEDIRKSTLLAQENNCN